ncbi:MAG: ribonuclease HI family protein [bacterium]|nr:ribonuclease HI family protein [bacterium]
MKSLILYFDGTSRPNPGKSACSYVILGENSEVMEKSGRYLAEGTNNTAEYLGLIFGLIACIKYNPENLTIHTDSNLVIQQIGGNYRVRDRELKKLHLIAQELMKFFKKIEIVHVPHEKNQAHFLAQEYLERNLFD